MKKLIYVVLSITIIIYGCAKDELLDDSRKITEVSDREFGNTAPGAFEISDGMLVFPDNEELNKTIDYLNNAKGLEIEAWRADIPFATIGKDYAEFQDQICCGDFSSEQDVLELEQVYADRIKINYGGGDGEPEGPRYGPKTPIMQEILNRGGVLKIGDGYLKVCGGKLFSILKDDIALVESVNPGTRGYGVGPNGIIPPHGGAIIPGVIPPSTDPETGDPIDIMETELLPRGGDDCCPEYGFVQKYYDSGQQRLNLRYEVYNTSRWVTFRGGSRVFEGAVSFFTRADTERRKSFIFSWWGCHRVDLSIEAAIEVEVTGSGNSIILNYTRTDSDDNTCDLGHIDRRIVSAFAGTQPEGFSFCVLDVDVTSTNSDANVTLNLDCDDDVIDPEPQVFMFDELDCGGNTCCTIDLTSSVGHVNFKNYAPCKNDAAKSARFMNMKAGMIMKIFDNSDGKTDDDYLIIQIHQDFANKRLNTFEPSPNVISDADWTVTYMEDDNLNGKVSSFRDF